jgi:hypothetical protein
MIPWLVKVILFSVITGAGLVTLMVVLRTYRIAARGYQRTEPRLYPYCPYVDKYRIENLYLQADRTLRAEIEKRVLRRGFFGFLRLLGIRIEGEAQRETVIRYIQDERPIPLMTEIIGALTSDNKIVDVNLRKDSIEWSKALDKALKAEHGRQALRLSDTGLRDLAGYFVSVGGKFEQSDKDDKTTTFSAPYGNRANENHVDIPCLNDNFEEKIKIPGGRFEARCVGRILKDSEPGRLVIEPIALFY